MHIYGLTGGIASGKTTVSSHLRLLGCPVIDADVISRQVVEPGKPAWKAIIGTFGIDILNDDHRLNRSKLASIIFNDEEKRRTLNDITHPYIQGAMLWQLVKYFLKGKPFVVLVSPLMFESNRYLNFMKKIIVVSCSEEQQLERLMTRDNLSKDEALKRVSAQIPLQEKCRRGNYIIDNSRETRFTEQQTFNLYYDMKRMSQACGLYKWLAIITFILVIILFKILFINE